MKTLSIYVFVVFAMMITFSAIPIIAQQKSPVIAKPIVSNPSVQKPSETPISSAMEQAVLNEINAARKEPQKYAQYLRNYKKLYRGKTVYLSGDHSFDTFEGTAAVDEAINYLEQLPARGALAFSDGLNKVAALQLKDSIADSAIGHKGGDGSNLAVRLKRFGTGGIVYAENIAYEVDTPQAVVFAMIIDDAVKSRIHRTNLFNPNVKIVGIAFGKNKAGRGLCVIDFADRFYETNPKSGVRQF